jgi:hypothetical protein
MNTVKAQPQKNIRRISVEMAPAGYAEDGTLRVKVIVETGSGEPLSFMEWLRQGDLESAFDLIWESMGERLKRHVKEHLQ